jgi:hypothetical protein
MKTLNINFKKKIYTVSILVFGLLIGACQTQGQKSGQDNEGSVTTSESVERPATAIHTAAFLGNLEAIQQHIAYGSDLNQQDAYGSSPLHIAATFGKTEIAQALIKGGANLNLRSPDGSTALHTAAFFCRTDIVKSLLENGADKNIKNNYGSTAKESVSIPFDSVRPIYDQISKDLGPLGLKLNYKHIENTRPIIEDLLK